jgi:hypothetical protein
MSSTLSVPKEDEVTCDEANKSIEDDLTDKYYKYSTNGQDTQPIKIQIVWKNVVLYIYFHIAALYGIYLCFTSAKWATIAWGKQLR